MHSLFKKAFVKPDTVLGQKKTTATIWSMYLGLRAIK